MTKHIDIQKIELEEYGFSGYLTKSNESIRHGVVVILGGESVMLPFLKLGKMMAKEFSKHGLIAVSVSLFGSDGLPDSPDAIPLEYAINAVKYLKEVENCTKITVYGMSMGSIVALATAIYSKDIDQLIMMSPSHVAFEGVSKDKKVLRNRSFLTYQHKDFPYVRADFSKHKMYEAYKIAYSDKEKEAISMAALPIREVKADILLLAGGKDTSWPSQYSVEILYHQLEKVNSGYSYQKLIYPQYGHLLPLKKEVMNQVYQWILEK